MDIMERIGLLKEYNIADQTAYDDLVAIIKLIRERFGILLTEENAGVMITHIAAAFGRNRSGESVNPLVEAAVRELREHPCHSQAAEMLEALQGVITNELNEIEREFVLLHLCNLLYSINKKRGKEKAQ